MKYMNDLVKNYIQKAGDYVPNVMNIRKYISEKDERNNKKKKTQTEQVTFHNLYFPSNKVHCDACEKDISRQARILCRDCPETADICVNCFLNQVEFEPHQQSHSYSIINKLTFPLFVEDWSAEEELLLLEGLEKKGFGNWQDICEMMGGDKTQEEVAQHYDEIILSGKYKKMPVIHDRERVKRIARKAIRKEEPKKTSPPALPSGQEIVGYMPRRGDFDIEFDNDAELLLAEMEFNDDDKPFEVEMKLKVLEIYNLRLDERIKRKKFVIERDLLNLKKQNILDKQRTKEEKELHNLMKPFARFNKPEDHERLVQNLIREKQLRAKIEELRYYRKIGLKTFEDIESYLAEKKKKDEHWSRRQKQNDSFVYDSKRFTQRRTRYTPMIENAGKSKALPHFSEEEYNLCEKLGLSHHEYLIVKEVLIRESVRLQYLSKDQVLQDFKLDKDRVTGVFDYLVTRGLIHQKE